MLQYTAVVQNISFVQLIMAHIIYFFTPHFLTLLPKFVKLLFILLTRKISLIESDLGCKLMSARDRQP